MSCTTECLHCEDKSKNVLLKIEEFLDKHDKFAGELYYKYDNKYFISEIKEDIRNIIREARKE